MVQVASGLVDATLVPSEHILLEALDLASNRAVDFDLHAASDFIVYRRGRRSDRRFRGRAVFQTRSVSALAPGRC